jgi:hypothetical protein
VDAHVHDDATAADARTGDARVADGAGGRRPAAATLSGHLLDMQRLAGNRAVAGALPPRPRRPPPAPAVPARTPTVQRDTDAPPGKVDEAANDLYKWLVATTPDIPRVLHTILLQKGHREELKKTYDAKGRSLWNDLAALKGDDVVRGRCYLDYGELRAADKLYIAIHGKLTDTTTAMRIVREISGGRAKAEDDFEKTYAKEYPEEHTLPNGEKSRIASALLAELLSATFADRFKALAMLAFGTPRPADEVKIATVGGAKDSDTLLFGALQREDPKKLATEFEASYKEPLKGYLSRELSFHTKARALMLIDENVKPEDRLIETVRIATSGYTTADSDFIFDAVQHSTTKQLDKFRAAVATKDPRVSHMDDTFGGMSKVDRDKFNALVGLGDDTGILGDPVVTRLRAEGGNNGDGIFGVFKNATGFSWKQYGDEYAKPTSALNRFVSPLLGPDQKGWLLSYVFTDFRARLNYVMTNPGNDDYIIFLLTTFSNDADRRKLATDADFGAKFGKLSTATQNRILMVLQPASMTPVERAVWLDAAVKRETSTGVGSLSSTAAATEDENRELQAARERATAGGKTPTPEEQAEIDRLAGKTQEALTAYIGYRDELEALVSTVVDIAVGLIMGLATGGVASVEMVMLAAARAAMANAMAKVVSRKLVMGDRFDVIGADGAAAFVTGAVDGMLNVVGPLVGAGIGGTALETTAAEAARTAAPQTFKQFASTTGAKMAEGAVTGGMSGTVESMTNDKTWAEGFDRGLRKTLESGVRGAATGAAMNALPPAVAGLVTAGGVMNDLLTDQVIDSLPPGEASLERISLRTSEAAASAPTPAKPAGAPVQGNWGKAYEAYIESLLWRGQLTGVPQMDYVIQAAHNAADNGIDRIGLVITPDGRIEVYHFEMKWRNPPEEGGPKPAELTVPDENSSKKRQTLGTQSGKKWTADAVELLCNSDHPQAIAALDAVVAAMAHASGKPLVGSGITRETAKEFLRKNITPHQIVVVPYHVDTTRLWKQLMALMRHGRQIRMVRNSGPRSGPP